ncbi:MAG: DNA-directed RNA polymerase subunit alpha [Candidatus Jorgensenbacteria bacterium]|nr:DNA-directed RNA polymerase subunit alpha [Candidatus Jorgensenbacteria bacterium]
MEYKLLSDTVEVKKISEKNNVGVFHVEGLYTGYGMTLGNALRRVLLSSFPGAAITQIKIDGVDHEFSTVPNVSEDVVEFCLNLKKVRFLFYADEPQVLQLHKKGDGEVTAGDIQSTTFAKVINPDLHLATLTKKGAELLIELTVEKGLGYVPAESRRLERLPVGVIVLDAVFSPIVRVAFSVENMRVGDRTDYNRLFLEIETDGTISPSDALHKASNILKDHFGKVSNIEVTKLEPTEIKEAKVTREKKKKK